MKQSRCPHATPRADCDECRRRRSGREYRRRERRKQLAAKVVGRTTCPQRFCGGKLETTTDAIGRTVVVCAWCDRKARGLCRDCPKPVEGRVGYALRCATHKHEANRASIRRYEERNLERVRESQRKHYNQPEVRAHRLEYKRLWRKANPEKIKAQKRRAALRQPKRVLVYMKHYRGKHREYYRDLSRKLYRKHNPPPVPKPCIRCGGKVKQIDWPKKNRPLAICDDCVFPYERKRRQRIRRSLGQQRRHAAPPPRPRRIRAPKHRKYNANGDRLCLGEGCETIVTGRTKKCDPCKARDRAAAMAALRAGPFSEVA